MVVNAMWRCREALLAKAAISGQHSAFGPEPFIHAVKIASDHRSR
jgi:hypothetical protein